MTILFIGQRLCRLRNSKRSQKIRVWSHVRAPAMPTSLGRHRWDDFGAYVASEMRAGRTLVVDEVRVHPGHSAGELAAYESVGIRAYVAVPLAREGRIVAYLAVNNTTPRAWTAGDWPRPCHGPRPACGECRSLTASWRNPTPPQSRFRPQAVCLRG